MSVAADELLGLVSDALGSHEPTLEGLLAGVRQRAEERARNALQRRLDALLSSAGGEPPPDRGPTPAAVPAPAPSVAPDQPLEVRLGSGRRLRMALAPAVARRGDLVAVGRVSAANDRRAFAAIRRHGHALASLRQSHEDLVRKVAALEKRADEALVGLLRQVRALDGQVEALRVHERALLAQGRSTQRLAVRQRRTLQSMAASAHIQKLTAVVASAQSAAYGQKGSALATSNLLLAGNQLLWGFIDPLLRGIGLVHGASPSLLAWLAPLGSLLTGYAVVGSNRQHVRFVSGVANFQPGALSFQDSLRTRIADALWPEFQRRTDVPVTTVALDPGRGPTAGSVQNGVLRITLGAAFLMGPLGRGRVAWMVDTGVDVG
jgi:hypothetical protein